MGELTWGLLADTGGGLKTWDHVVIGVYLLSMLGMGFYIALRNRSTEDFFLGGRNMPSWAIGISLIASLLSTITYLGMPGEMFRTGTLFLTRQIGLPLVLLVVWYLWLPFFMRLRLTSAYEYLERRFNYATRAIAAVFCLMLLFGWISVVVLTASKAMAEIADLNVGWFFGTNVPATKTRPDGSALISAEDLQAGWKEAAQDLVKAGESLDPAPAGRIWRSLDGQAQADVREVASAAGTASEQKARFAAALSTALPSRELFDDKPLQGNAGTLSVFAGITPDEGAGPLIKAGLDKLSDLEVTELNRALLAGVFPRAVGKLRPEYRDADMHLLILSIGVFSILYTTMGGMRAVVWTDVVQFFVLIAGAFVTMGIVAWETDSGMMDWLATSSAQKREEVPWFSWDVGTRSTVFNIAIGMFFWHACTHGSNQVALQRYFSVRDIRAARWSFFVNFAANIALGIILAGVGIALMHFVLHHDVAELSAMSGLESKVISIRNESQDKIFPQFIHSSYFPAGLRGLVVAALFAAAMSTIDSGANSVSTIVTVDFFRPFYPEGTTATAELKLARILTATMGFIVVATTIFLYHISKGTDLITICQKGFNCFLGPLGALFVLALFCRWATPASVIPALVVGEIFGVAASYSTEFFGPQYSYSTHYVIPGAWLATIVSCGLFALLLQTKATDEQAEWMWRPVVRHAELPHL